MEIKYTVDEAVVQLLTRLAEATGFRYLKSQRCLKKTIGQFIFEVDLFTSKWNLSGERVEAELDFSLFYKKRGTITPADRVIAWKGYHPEEDNWYDTPTSNWYNITTPAALDKAFNALKRDIWESAVWLSELFASDENAAYQYLLNDGFEEYHVYLDFLAEKLGMDAISCRAEKVVSEMSDELRQQVNDYHNGARNKTWMLNRGNIRFVADNGFV